VHIHHRPSLRFTWAGLLRWVRSGEPRAAAWLDWNRADAALAAWARQSYDVVWFSHCHAWLALNGAARGPTIVDFDNLEDEKLRTLIELRHLQRTESPVPRRARALVAAQLDRIDLGRWRRVQRRAARDARAVVVCSALDRDRLGAPSAVVIPNGYELPPGTGPTTPPADPVLTMVGLLVYPPNLDAARFFAGEVMPLIRPEVPDARFRIVGRHDGLLDDLGSQEDVEVTGEVADLGEAFRTTAAVVVPLRTGSGTRIKVLEAFARRKPVVSTTLGSEGLGARDGVEVLNADTARGLADACIRVLREPDVAASLGAAGHELWSRGYRWEGIRTRIAELATRVAAS
jgi:glycosyltransferase involved in cell wall biosynthesis